MNIFHVLISIGIAQSAGIVGSLFTAGSVQTWYLTITKPAWNPPGWIFGPAWITLYTLMGIAAYLLWQQRSLPEAKIALWVYGIHLIFNALWSILFFGLKNPALAFAEIVVLLLLITATIVLFWRIHPLAGALLLPYLAWVSFATYLNYTIWQLN